MGKVKLRAVENPPLSGRVDYTPRNVRVIKFKISTAIFSLSTDCALVTTQREEPVKIRDRVDFTAAIAPIRFVAFRKTIL